MDEREGVCTSLELLSRRRTTRRTTCAHFGALCMVWFVDTAAGQEERKEQVRVETRRDEKEGRTPAGEMRCTVVDVF
jgi:hypothetical protein